MKQDYSDLRLSYLATEARKKWKLDFSSPIDYQKMCILLNTITLIECPFSDTLGGVILKDSDDNCIIAINSKLILADFYEIFAHELYHFLTKSVFSAAIPSKSEMIKNEDDKNADVFANYFLMPKEALIDFFHNQCNSELSFDSVLKISLYFNVHYLRVLNRLNKENIFIDLPNELIIIDELNKRGLPNNLYMPKRTDDNIYGSGRYFALANKLLEEEKISEGKYNELLKYFGE